MESVRSWKPFTPTPPRPHQSRSFLTQTTRGGEKSSSTDCITGTPVGFVFREVQLTPKSSSLSTETQFFDKSRQFYIGVDRKCPESFYPIFLPVAGSNLGYRCDPLLMEKAIAFAFFIYASSRCS